VAATADAVGQRFKANGSGTASATGTGSATIAGLSVDRIAADAARTTITPGGTKERRRRTGAHAVVAVTTDTTGTASTGRARTRRIAADSTGTAIATDERCSD
jgi:hypothetical protein